MKLNRSTSCRQLTKITQNTFMLIIQKFLSLFAKFVTQLITTKPFDGLSENKIEFHMTNGLRKAKAL